MNSRLIRTHARVCYIVMFVAAILTPLSLATEPHFVVPTLSFALLFVAGIGGPSKWVTAREFERLESRIAQLERRSESQFLRVDSSSQS